MDKLQVLRVKRPGSEETEILDFEQARDIFNKKGQLVVVEDHLISSYAELCALAEKAQYRKKAFLDIRLMPIFFGG
jgi:hypothetical protein